MINPELEFKFEPSENPFVITWKIPEQLSYFEGHFPGFPVLPGVALIDVTLEALRRSLSISKIELLKLENAKFKRPLSPGNIIEISIVAGSDPSRWSAAWRLVGEPALVAELSLQLRL